MCLNEEHPVIAVSDYVKLVSEQISAYVKSYFISLLRIIFFKTSILFEINRYYIVISAINSLVKTNKIDKKILEEAINKYKIDPNKKNPLKI